MEALAVTIVCLFSFASLLSASPENAGAVGLALVYAIQMTAMFQRTVQLSVMASQQVTACERVLSFETVEPEAALALPEADAKLPACWPRGEVRFESVQLRYRGGDLILKGVSFTAARGERVGVCGRTGAGKSSLLSALFRIVEPCSGAIYVDGIDIGTVGLKALRDGLAIIPQEPVIFSGSLRSNLDPFGNVKDDGILMDALDKVGLRELVGDDASRLEMCIAERGDNLSQGQRQLLCIARVCLRRARITVLDEATSAMDAQTDQAVQLAMAEHWKSVAGGEGEEHGGTMITIAHRLSTILDYDKILVLSYGQVVEFDSPEALQANPASALSQMLNDSGSAATTASPSEADSQGEEGTCEEV
eukprot:TRINITY_DN28011_c0_g2_i2.p1 TRINITY_DN28011_c0_g2~~TRINITY_DN28011_c0_g2_i2.p1  ORF type:complete len:363 (+),score=106.35 TRINITY_DN28011_c0_g2_i2:1329-2417(+)